MDTSVIDKLTFVTGVGAAKDDTACLMSAARILAGEATITDARSDNCARVCPVVRRFAIGVNDWRGWKSAEERTATLKPLTTLLLDTYSDDVSVVRKRAFILADVAVRVFAPEALEARGLKEHAEKLRALAPIVDKETALVGKTAADAAYAAAYAAANAAAYAAANAAAYAAVNAAYAAANAAYAAANAAAYAAANAAAYAANAAHETVKQALVDALIRICKVSS